VVGLAHGGERRAGQLGRRGVVEADHRQLSGDGNAALLGRPHGPEGELVAHGQQGGGPVVPVQQGGGRAPARVLAIGAALLDGHGPPVEPRRLDRGPVAEQPLADHLVAGGGLPVLVGRALVAVRGQGRAHHPEATMAELQEVPCRQRRAAAVVDPDVPGPRERRPVDHHQGQPAVDHGLDPLVVLDVVLADEPVHQGGPDQVAALAAADQDQPDPGLAAGVGHPLQEQHVGRVAEGEAEGIVRVVEEQQAQRAHPAAAEGGRQRVGPRIAEPLGRLQDLGPQGGAELVGVVVGVGDGGPGDAELAG
jgi:hypothetical protein